MALESGSRLGNYEISDQIGKGGMGEVYRGRDTQLRREVAIKVLPSEFAEDSERLVRFEREARLLASLNHPNIAAIHGLEEHEGTRFLVLELVEGDTLADRMEGGPIPEGEALKIALQIAEAIEAAHEKGVIHRDLKPANVKITPDGKVKVLDFGLAKSFVGDDIDVNLSNSPTMSAQATQQGVILGTAGYMSPEQVRGRPLDKRTDIWSCGVVLYEMLTGRRLFAGETISDIVAGVLRAEPDWNAVPVRFRKLLRRCLERDLDKRLRHVGDIELLLDDEAADSARTSAPRRPWLWPAVASAAVVASIAWVMLQPDGPTGPLTALRLAIPEPEDLEFTDLFSISPDGLNLAFVGNSDSGAEIWIRELETETFRQLTDLRDQSDLGLNGTPIWSPDGRFVAFWLADEEQLLKMEVSSGRIQRIAEVPGALTSGFWNSDDWIVFSYSGSNGLWKAPAEGGTRTPVTTGAHGYASALPDGRLLYTDSTRTVYVGSVDATPEEQTPFELLDDVDAAVYVSAPEGRREGYLLLLRGGTLSAESFDPVSLRRGEPDVVATSVARRLRAPSGSSGTTQAWFPLGFSASSSRVIYRTSELESMRLTWFDEDGNPIRAYEELATYSHIDLSPDGNRLAAVRDLDPGQFAYDIFVYDLIGPERNRPLTSWPQPDFGPAWSADGSRIAYLSYRGGSGYHIYVRAADGSGDAEPLYEAGAAAGQLNWSPDDRFILFGSDTNSRGLTDIWLLSVEEGDARPLIATTANESFPEFSPDGRWIAYNSDAGFGIFVQKFDPSPDARPPALPASVGRAFMAHWAADSRRLFYMTDPGRVLMVVDVTEDPDGNPLPGEPRRLFEADPADDYWWDVAPEGDRFIMPVSISPADAAAFRVVSDWTATVND